jgi:hypothetical protein
MTPTGTRGRRAPRAERHRLLGRAATDWRADPIVTAAISGTPGARVTEHGLVVPVVRWQQPIQAGAPAIRGGVFYMTPGSAAESAYRAGRNGHGGPMRVRGDIRCARPLVVAGAVGKVYRRALDNLLGRGAWDRLQTVAVDTLWPELPPDERTSLPWGTTTRPGLDAFRRGHRTAPRYGVVEVLVAYGYADDAAQDIADAIVRYANRPEQVVSAVRDAVLAHHARAAGHDAVVGYARRRSRDETFFTEVFDLTASVIPAGDLPPLPDG